MGEPKLGDINVFKGLVDAKLYGWSSSSTFKEHVAEADKKDFDRGQNNPGYPPSTLPFPPELDRRLDPQAVDDKTPFAELLLPKEIFDAMRGPVLKGRAPTC